MRLVSSEHGQVFTLLLVFHQEWMCKNGGGIGLSLCYC